MKKSDAQRHYEECTTATCQLDIALFQIVYLSDSDEVHIDISAQRLIAAENFKLAHDSLMALCSGSAQHLQNEAAAIKLNFMNNLETTVEHDKRGEPLTDFVVVLTIRELLARAARLHDVATDRSGMPYDRRVMYLEETCKNIGQSIKHLMNKAVLKAMPAGEHAVKHVLFSIVSSIFPDAKSDGQITFETKEGAFKPDLGVPSLQTAVELKVAQGVDHLPNIITGLIGDLSTYGSADYNTFLAVIYTPPGGVDQALVDKVVQDRMRLLGAEPHHKWKWIVAIGPLSVKNKRDRRKLAP